MWTQPEFQVSLIFLYTNIYLLNIFKNYLCGIEDNIEIPFADDL